jgi:hypothetical protein
VAAALPARNPGQHPCGDARPLSAYGLEQLAGRGAAIKNTKTSRVAVQLLWSELRGSLLQKIQDTSYNPVLFPRDCCDVPVERGGTHF